MKKTFTSYIALGFLITLVGNFSLVYAQTSIDAPAEYCKTSSICGTAPKNFILMLDFVREMMNSIKTIGTQGSYLGQYVNPNRFAGNLFSPPQQAILSKAARNVVQKAEFTLASTAIFSNPMNFGGFQDFAGSTVLLGQSSVFLRDAKLVESLESLLNDKKYELGMGAGWFEKVNPTNLKIMQTILKSYIDQGVFTSASSIADGVLYSNITSLLTKILASAKTLLYYDTLSSFDEITRGGDVGIKIVFDPASMAGIQKDYSCARGFNVCSTSLKKFTANRKNLGTTINKGLTSGFLDIFTNAVDRLVQTFSKESNQTDAFKARQTDLLKSMYGTAKIASGSVFQRIANGQLISVTSDAGQELSGVLGDVAAFRSPIKDLPGKTTEIQTTQTKEGTLPAISAVSAVDQGKVNFENILRSSVQDVFSQQVNDNALVSSSETKTVTPAFNILGQQVNSIKDDILGGKDKDGSLIKSLGEACELQCGRGGLCRK